MNQTAYFNLDQVLINEIFGTGELFIFGGALIILLVCLKYKIPMFATTLIEIIFIAIGVSMATQLAMPIWVFIIFGIAIIFAAGILKQVSRLR